VRKGPTKATFPIVMVGLALWIVLVTLLIVFGE
jgi:hypothetical protein